ncbi:hypothetical protein SAY87_021886 [Trapa incisa]|uniref:Uncharacterized protein n=1 Tax=Trapa incisa TaxID=236973 RepID=A0AAN7JSK8_9MYRT|nr:hypothetical protein SAY87_021886 [Trapa incisa]
MAAAEGTLLLLTVLIPLQVSILFGVLHAQQEYLNNRQLNCSNSDSITRGFACNATSDQPSCQSYLTFRSADPSYANLATIAYLLNSDAVLMTTLNNLTDVQAIPAGTPIIVPANCSCFGELYQHNATYILKAVGETYYSIAYYTYQGLSTCQALQDQNLYKATNLTVGESVLVPLRCACPTSAQSGEAIRYLLTYLVASGDTLSGIAELFGVTLQSVLDANRLTIDSVIYPLNPILVPLTKEPTKIILPATPSPPPSSATSPATTGSSSSKKWIFIGVGIGLAVVLIIAAAAFCYRTRKGRKMEEQVLPASAPPPKKASEPSATEDHSALLKDSSSWSGSGFREAIHSLTIYKYEELQRATGSFAEGNKIRGSVYRGSFKGDTAAVKVVRGDVSGEINILKLINHMNIVRLSGFCLYEGNSYLVYEYAENGSLSDWLHGEDPQATLSWKQRIQIAYNIADAINYLHNYVNPPYIHKNLKSSNVLLDADFKAKVSNFGLARSVDGEDGGGLQLTRHVIGTQGYMAPEYIEDGVITKKMDIFAFGVVMLELLSGREAARGQSKDREELLSTAISRVLEGDNVRDKLRGFMDVSMRNEYPLDLAFSTAGVARRCVEYDMNSRPSMEEVLMALTKIFSSSTDWDPSSNELSP